MRSRTLTSSAQTPCGLFTRWSLAAASVSMEMTSRSSRHVTRVFLLLNPTGAVLWELMSDVKFSVSALSRKLANSTSSVARLV